MRNQKFDSCLDADKVISRIKQYAKPAKRGYQLITGTVFYRIYDNKKFWLIKTTPLGAPGQTPFCANIFVNADGLTTTIIGRFTPPPEMKFLLIPFTLIAPVFILLMGGLNFLLPALLFGILGNVIIYVIFYMLSPVFWKKERQAVIAFIEKHLLS